MVGRVVVSRGVLRIVQAWQGKARQSKRRRSVLYCAPSNRAANKRGAANVKSPTISAFIPNIF